MTKPPPNVLELPLAERAVMTFKEAVEELIIEHARTGAPFYIWRDGKVIAMPKEELEAEAARVQKD
ncbi:MAG TPA: hypothetical protein VMU45_03095 [Candidatus Eisenbacteria bacterium]|nr:hypothetical protein [Candidatus Eisenbacteria bacterium]